MDRIFIFLFGVPLGFIIMIYRVKIHEFTGDIAFAEQYLGSGGTYTLILLIGLLVSFMSVSYAFGAFQDFFSSTFGMFFQ